MNERWTKDERKETIVKYANSQTQIVNSEYSRYASRLCVDVSSLFHISLKHSVSSILSLLITLSSTTIID